MTIDSDEVIGHEGWPLTKSEVGRIAIVPGGLGQRHMEPQLPDPTDGRVGNTLRHDRLAVEVSTNVRAERDRGLAILLADPALALWAMESALRHRVSPTFMLGLLAEALETGASSANRRQLRSRSGDGFRLAG